MRMLQHIYGTDCSSRIKLFGSAFIAPLLLFAVGFIDGMDEFVFSVLFFMALPVVLLAKLIGADLFTCGGFICFPNWLALVITGLMWLFVIWPLCFRVLALLWHRLRPTQLPQRSWVRGTLAIIGMLLIVWFVMLLVGIRPPFCSITIDSDSRDRCYQAWALRDNDRSLCMYVDDSPERCHIIYDAQRCLAIDAEGWLISQDAPCLIEQARLTGEQSFCELIHVISTACDDAELPFECYNREYEESHRMKSSCYEAAQSYKH